MVIFWREALSTGKTFQASGKGKNVLNDVVSQSSGLHPEDRRGEELMLNQNGSSS
jgi:hypothetical protein